MLSALGRLWARHERIGQCVAAGTICGTGDAICQSFEILVYDRSPETANTSNFKLFKGSFQNKLSLQRINALTYDGESRLQ